MAYPSPDDLRKKLGLPDPFSSEDTRVFPYLLAIIERLEGIEAALLRGDFTPPHKPTATATKPAEADRPSPGKPRPPKRR